MVHVRLLAKKFFSFFFFFHVVFFYHIFLCIVFYVFMYFMFPFIHTAAPLQFHKVLHSDLYSSLHL